MLKKIFESPLDSKEIKPVNLKGNQPWILNRRTDTEAEAPVFWAPDTKSWLTGKDPDAGKDWGQEENRTSEDEMVGWHHQCKGRELGHTSGDGEGQGGLACCSPWSYKELDTTRWLKQWKFISLSSNIKNVQGQGASQIGFILSPLLLACRGPPSGHVLTWPLLCVFVEKKSKLSDVSSFKGIDPIMRAPSSWFHLTLITSQRLHLQIPSYWGLGIQHTDLVVTWTFSP